MRGHEASALARWANSDWLFGACSANDSGTIENVQKFAMKPENKFGITQFYNLVFLNLVLLKNKFISLLCPMSMVNLCLDFENVLAS